MVLENQKDLMEKEIVYCRGSHCVATFVPDKYIS